MSERIEPAVAYAAVAQFKSGMGELPPAPKYLSTTPVKFVTRIPLIDVFERLKKVKADTWQRDFCRRLQAATESRHIRGVRALVHAQPQLGKSVILAQIFPVWLLGHDPLHRFALATYNIKRSQRHAKVAVRIMQSVEYKDLFPHKDTQLPPIVGVDNIFTNARYELNDGQASFNPMGLQSGFVGAGADTLAMDDPYKNSDEAKSETIRENIEDFVDEVADVRLTEYANWFGMFHRYHQADLAGYLLAKGEFDYWRYASQADGSYVDDETGLIYPDPLDRQIGEYISPRFSNDFYERQKSNPRTWYSQFQGKPTGEEGTTFNIKKIRFLDPFKDFDEIESLRREMLHWSRAWDNAATKKDTSAFTVGARSGIAGDGRVLIDSIIRKRLDTAERYDEQLETAEADGFLVPVLIPNDPGSAGTDTAFQTKQMLENERYTCIADVVTGSKEARAQPLSLAVNSGMVTVALGEEETKEFKKEFKNFPLSAFKDQVDAAGDSYRFNYKMLKSGAVIKNYSEMRNLISLESFVSVIGSDVPSHWRFYAAARVSEDAKFPSGAVIMAQSAKNAPIEETLFLLDEFRHLAGDYYRVFDWINERLACYRPQQQAHIYLRTDSESVGRTARAKLKMPVREFGGDNLTGIAELNWFFLPRRYLSPFHINEEAAGIYFVKRGENDLVWARQESVIWRYNDQGEPQNYGGVVMDCVRIITSGFNTISTPLTPQEEYAKAIAAIDPRAAIDYSVKNEYNPVTLKEQTRLDYAHFKAQEMMKAKYDLEDDDDW